LCFFGTPIFLLCVESFWSIRNYQSVPDFTLANYAAVLSQPYLRLALVNSVVMSASIAFSAAALSLPIAFALLLIRKRALLFGTLFVLLLPFLLSTIVRALGWQTWLSNNGVLAPMYRLLGLDQHGLLYTQIATGIGLMSLALPIAVLLAYVAMRRVPHDLYLAAINLRARPWHLLRHLVFPAALPGSLVGFLFNFILLIADFIAPVTLGGGMTYYFGVAIVDRFKINDWPQAAAMGVVLAVLAVCAISAMFSLLNPILRREAMNGNQSSLETRILAWVIPTKVRFWFSLALGVTILFVLAPTLSLALSAFSRTSIQSYTINGFTTKWFDLALRDPLYVRGAWNSFFIACASGAMSVSLGATSALAIARGHVRHPLVYLGLIATPAVFPTLLTGMAAAS
jgi:ABC-type spermidine/putrescine transport system permease subunit I